MLDGRAHQGVLCSSDFSRPNFGCSGRRSWGSLPEHSAIEFRRYMNRFLYLFGHCVGHGRRDAHAHKYNTRRLSSRWSRGCARAEALELPHRRLRARTSVSHRRPDRMTVDRFDYMRGGSATSVAVAPEDIVLVTTGSQAADGSAGTMRGSAAARGRAADPGRCGPSRSRASGIRQTGSLLRSDASIPFVALGDLHGHRHGG